MSTLNDGKGILRTKVKSSMSTPAVGLSMTGTERRLIEIGSDRDPTGH